MDFHAEAKRETKTQDQGNQARDFSTADGLRFTQIKEDNDPSLGKTQAEMS